VDLTEDVEWCPSRTPSTQKQSIVAPDQHFFYRPHLMESMDVALEKAHILQYALLPRQLPAHAPCRLSAVLESYCHLSGDLFGWHETPDGGLMLWLVDMSGHGAPAGVLSAHLKILIDDAQHIDDPAALATELNTRMYESLRSGNDVPYATGVFLRLHEKRLRAVVAAHPPMLLRRHGELQHIASSGRPLGVFSDSSYSASEIPVDDGDLLLLYTDGILEAGNAAGEEFGLARLERAFREGPGNAADASRHIYDAVSAYQDMNYIDDDVTFLTIEC
jgi:serine phosphatase RsbU (regulator of sigma subunit)